MNRGMIKARLRSAAITAVVLGAPFCIWGLFAVGRPPPPPVPLKEPLFLTKQMFEWENWRGHACRFVGLLEDGVFVCMGGITRPGSISLDLQGVAPATNPPLGRPPFIQDIDARHQPEIFKRVLDKVGPNPFLDPVSSADESQFREWLHWRADHCELRSFTGAGNVIFACGDNIYRAQVRNGTDGKAYERHIAPKSWVDARTP